MCQIGQAVNNRVTSYLAAHSFCKIRRHSLSGLTLERKRGNYDRAERYLGREMHCALGCPISHNSHTQVLKIRVQKLLFDLKCKPLITHTIVTECWADTTETGGSFLIDLSLNNNCIKELQGL